MDIIDVHNVAAVGVTKRLSVHATATAASTGDATSVTGITIDRAGFSNGGRPRSALMSVLYDATLASGKTLSIGYAVQDSEDGTNWSDYLTATYATVATGASGGSNAKGAFNIPVDLGSARRYVRLNFNPDLNASGTDTAYAQAAGFFAGFDRLPAPTA